MTELDDTYGRLTESDQGWRLEFTRRLAHPPTKVWQALTEPGDLAAWFPTTIEGQRATGARLRFAFGEPDSRSCEGEMLTYEPPRVLEFLWCDGDMVRFELRPDGTGTVLALAHTFKELGKAAHDGAGWHETFEKLDSWLGGQKATFDDGTRYLEVLPWYRDHFGPDASRLGPPEHHW